MSLEHLITTITTTKPTHSGFDLVCGACLPIRAARHIHHTHAHTHTNPKHGQTKKAQSVIFPSLSQIVVFVVIIFTLPPSLSLFLSFFFAQTIINVLSQKQKDCCVCVCVWNNNVVRIITQSIAPRRRTQWRPQELNACWRWC